MRYLSICYFGSFVFCFILLLNITEGMVSEGFDIFLHWSRRTMFAIFQQTVKPLLFTSFPETRFSVCSSGIVFIVIWNWIIISAWHWKFGMMYLKNFVFKIFCKSASFFHRYYAYIYILYREIRITVWAWGKLFLTHLVLNVQMITVFCTHSKIFTWPCCSMKIVSNNR